MRIIFMGTPDFAVPCLEGLIKSNNEIIGVFTQPDKKKGRGYAVAISPVKETALKHSIPVFQPSSLKEKEIFDLILELKPDLIIVVAYGKILPKNILEIPPMGCINVHGSLLPKYRGAAPIQWSVINGEKTTGITTMYMDEGLDTGDMIFKVETEIYENETSGELYDRLRIMGAELLMKTLEEIQKGNVSREKQDNTKSTYAPVLDKTLSKINWHNRSDKIHNLIRGLNPWPIAAMVINGINVKVYKSIIAKPMPGDPGEVKSIYPFIVSCGDNTAIEILELQLESKKRMKSEDFFRGHKLDIGTILG